MLGDGGLSLDVCFFGENWAAIPTSTWPLRAKVTQVLHIPDAKAAKHYEGEAAIRTTAASASAAAAAAAAVAEEEEDGGRGCRRGRRGPITPSAARQPQNESSGS